MQKSSTIITSWRQLKAILWKNWLLKQAHLGSLVAEVSLPVLFMGLLILIKTVTDVLNSPNVAYFCGQNPWYHGSSLYDCTLGPTSGVCQASNYYQSPLTFTLNGLTVTEYTQYGYVPSSASSGATTNPFYAYSLASDTPVYNEASMTNPSLPINQVLGRLVKHNAVLAIAPASSSDIDSTAQAKGLIAYLQAKPDCLKYSSAIQYFDSESYVNDYVTNDEYDDPNYGFGKIAFAIIFNSVDVSNANWDYSIRVNYTSGRDTSDKTVACLNGPTNRSAIAFGGYTTNSCQYTYSIPSTKFYTNDLSKPQTASNAYGYTYSGFSTLQLLVDEYIFSLYLPNFQGIQASLSMMPTVSYETDNFQSVISSTLGIFYMLSFLYPVSGIIRALVVDKETRIKEGMKMMGLTDFVYNLSWSISLGLQMTLVSVLITIITSSSVFEYSNKVLVFIYFEVFSVAIINMCFLLATLFSRSKVASLLGPMIFFASFFPYYAVNDPQFSTNAKISTCLLAPACFALGSTVFASYEGGMVGVQLSNMSTSVSNFSYAACIGMLVLDIILYGFLAWYLDKVIPTEFGVPLPFYFPLQYSYWKNQCDILGLWGQSSNHRNSDVTSRLLDSSDNKFVDINSSSLSGRIEKISDDLKAQKAENRCLSILNLRKVFKTPGLDRVAVENLSLDMFEGQVTCLLGHNGAGKSTTISMLVGLVNPTAGDANIRGLFISKDMQAVRRNLGVCPQHDILFSELTVRQHLQMFAAFKGMTGQRAIDAAADKMIAEVGLVEKQNTKSSALSGGQKRKLSLGIALIGDSKVIILDEPTSGMDPYSRRSTWNIIQKNKNGRVILLTTHFMDEADILGDRIAIMAEGKLQCVGSSLFLKSVYGVGYTLTIVKAHSATNADAVTSSTSIHSLITSYIQSAELLSNVGAEISFRLPFSSSEYFPRLFAEFEAIKSRGGLSEYGISVTTLEEVFLKVGRGEISDSQDHDEPISKNHSLLPNDSSLAKTLSSAKAFAEEAIATVSSALTPINYDQLADSDKELASSPKPRTFSRSEYADSGFAKHFVALLMKRAVYGKRDKRMFVCQLIIPVILVIVGIALLQIIPDLAQPDLILSPSQYNTDLSQPYQNFVPFYISDDSVVIQKSGLEVNYAVNSSLSSQIRSKFTGDSGNGVFGVAVPIDSNDGAQDQFESCSVGAAPLQRVSNYLISSLLSDDSDISEEKGSTRYGAVTMSNKTSMEYLIYDVMVNASAIHGAGVYVNLVNSAFLKVVTGIDSASITTHNYPLPVTNSQELESASASAFVVSLFCMIAFCFIPASFGSYVVKEAEVKAKHQQIVSGVNIYAYWVSNLVWDTLSYTPTPLLLLAVVNAFNVSSYIEGDAQSCFILLLLLYGPAVAANTYLISFLFTSHSSAQIMIMFFNFLTGLCLMVVSFVLSAISETSALNVSLRYMYLCFPSFCLGDGILQLALCINGESCPTITSNGFDYSQLQSPFSCIQNNLVFLGVEIAVYFTIVLMIEFLKTFPTLTSDVMALIWKKPNNAAVMTKIDSLSKDDEDEDEDVFKERQRVHNGGAIDDAVVIRDLRKVYSLSNPIARSFATFIERFQLRPQAQQRRGELAAPETNPAVKVAVQSLSFGVSVGECFGFLGINGAGKTTTLSILSGEFPPTSGSAYIDHLNTATDQVQIRRRIGYCPQFDALLELLSVREHLELFARIKGLSGPMLTSVVNEKIEQLDLGDFADKLAGSLSGGNKRKLSLAIALIGDPLILFLDEPSTGMDPVARRFMWNVISGVCTQGAGRSHGAHPCSVILTTHSMEEAEALCTKIGVMVNGRLRCLGSSQHLKERFGSGYEVHITAVVPTDDEVASVASTLTHLASSAGNGVVQGVEVNPMTSSVGHSNLLGDISTLRLDREQCNEACRLLGMSDRCALISAVGSGALLYQGLLSEGSISVSVFATWWVSEDRAQAIHDFLLSLSAKAQLLERSSANRFRYSVPKSGETSALAALFAAFEQRKISLFISEYAVGQTTLEQIFNHFASSQENPEVG